MKLQKNSNYLKGRDQGFFFFFFEWEPMTTYYEHEFN